MSDTLFRIKVLIVDDHPVMLTLLCAALSQLGLKNVTKVEDGQIALAMLKREEISLVFTDLNMPRMTGIQFIQQIRQQAGTRDLPVIVVSGENDQDMVAQAIQAGADAFIIKPFSVETIKKKIIEVLSKRA